MIRDEILNIIEIAENNGDVECKEIIENLESVKKEVFGLSGKEAYLAQREIDEINQDNRIFDAQQ